MFDTMTLTKIVGGFCGALLIFLLGKWAGEIIYHTGGGHGDDHHQAYVIDTGEDEGGGEGEQEGPSFAELFVSADIDKGERVFNKCKACHKLEDGANSTGPYLHGVVGREVASASGFGYSGALVAAADVWTPQNLDAFLANPSGFASGTTMAFSGLGNAEDRANVIAYLDQTDGDTYEIEVPAAAEAGGESGTDEEAAQDGAAEEGASEEAESVEGAAEETAPEEDAAEEAAPEEGAAEEDAPEEAASEESDAAENGSEETASSEGAAEESTSEEMASAEGAAEEDGSEETASSEGAAEESTSEETASAEGAAEGSGSEEMASEEETAEESTSEEMASAEGTAEESSDQDGASGFADMVAQADPGQGETVFRKCKACHTVEEGKNRVGPHLFGIVDRDIASVEDFRYSDALAEIEGDWTLEQLSGYLENPKDFAPGNKMSFAGLKDEGDRAAVISYLQSVTE